MNADVKYLLCLLKSVLYNETPPVPTEENDWDNIFVAAGAGEILTLLYKKIEELPLDKQPDAEKMIWLKNFSMQTGMKKLQCYDLLAQLLQEAEKRDIKVIVFKGPILATLYPEPLLRNSCDLDIYVEPKDLAAMEKLVVSLGYEKNIKHSKECVPVYVYSNILMLEVHCRLYEDYTGKRIDLLEAMDLTREDTRIQVNACGLDVVTLGYEQQLVFLIFHLVKHISYNGCTLKTIADIVLYINTYIKDIDKVAFWNKMKQLKYEIFCRTLFSIGCYYFGMTKEIFVDNSYSENIAVSMMQQLYYTGILKSNLEKKKDDRRAASIAFQSVYGKEDKKVSKGRIWLKTLFPSSKDLSFRYMYARKHPALVWVAWIHRAFNQLTIRFGNRDVEQLNMAVDVKLANQKLSLLKDLDLARKD